MNEMNYPPIIALFLLTVTLILFIFKWSNEDADLQHYRKSLIGKEAIINSSMLQAVILDYDPYSKMVVCRIDNGTNSTQRYQEVKFFLSELNVQNPK